MTDREAQVATAEAVRRRSRVWRRVRGIAAQTVLVAGLAAVAWLLADNAYVNMRTRGIPTDFSFWTQPSGFNIDQTFIPYDAATSTYGDAFFVGLLNTLFVATVGVGSATFFGFLTGAGMLSSNRLVARLCYVYVEIFRNIPPLLQILFWYNAVLKPLPAPRSSISVFGAAYLNNRGLFFPSLAFDPNVVWIVAAIVGAVAVSLALGAVSRRRRVETGRGLPVWVISALLLVGGPTLAFFLAGRPVHVDLPVLRGFNFRGGVHVVPELAALVLGLTTYTSAFIADVVRGGLQAVDRGQIEAARALGLGRGSIFRWIEAPQAMRVIVPPLTTQYLNLVKNSSLAVFVGYPDLFQVFAGTVLNQTGAAVQVIAITMTVYLVISLAGSLAMNVYNRRIALRGFR